jgi:hypothetical protein
VKYTDGDQEDLDGKEALELYHKTRKQTGDKAESVSAGSEDDEAHDADDTLSSASDDEESYVPSSCTEKTRSQIREQKIAVIFVFERTLGNWNGMIIPVACSLFKTYTSNPYRRKKGHPLQQVKESKWIC